MTSPDPRAVPDLAAAREKAEEWFQRREWVEDCTCADPDGGTCWYHLPAHLKTQSRVDSIVELLVEFALGSVPPRGEEVERIVRETLEAIENEPEGWSATAEEVARVIARVHARLERKGTP